MPGSLRYLFEHRERPRCARRWLKVWAKRTLRSVDLIYVLGKPCLWRLRGISVGRLTALGKARISGRGSRLSIGDECALGRCTIALHDEVRIGRRVVINDGVLILTASHDVDDPLWRHKRAPITIGDYVWIATGAIILPGVRLGRAAVVGAGAVVSRDVPAGGVVGGNPAQLIRSRRWEGLAYSPVLFTAPFEAWVGPDFIPEPHLTEAAHNDH
ncbi:acyltransferase [Paraburkholderia sp. GAS348]|uniref:acyltransferase n=1 Tax=Paraburkholderia sp. GAS348 TaxID=3035132 RepID=UPI003D260CCF